MPTPKVNEPVRCRDRTPRIREILYVRPDGLAAAVILGDDLEKTEILWTVKPPTRNNPEGDAYWRPAPR